MTALGADTRQSANLTQDLLAVLWRRRWIALATFVGVIAAVAIVTATLPKAYQTTAYVLVNPNRPASTDYEQTQVSAALLTTYSELLRSQNLADEVSRRLGSTSIGNPVNSISVAASSPATYSCSVEARSASARTSERTAIGPTPAQ